MGNTTCLPATPFGKGRSWTLATRVPVLRFGQRRDGDAPNQQLRQDRARMLRLPSEDASMRVGPHGFLDPTVRGWCRNRKVKE
jgi:hypothetical protein